MADKKWNERVSDLKKQISDVYAKCENSINELIEKNSGSNKNPLDNLNTGISLATEIDNLIKEANTNVVGILNNAINEAQAVAHSTGDKRVTAFLTTLLTLQSKVLNANNASDKKLQSTEKQIERRYMWQFYQNVIEAHEQFGIDMAINNFDQEEENRIDLQEDLDVDIEDIFRGLTDLVEIALNLEKTAGKFEDHLYDLVAEMDKYKVPNEKRDQYDLRRAYSINNMLFKRDDEGKFINKYDVNFDLSNMGEMPKRFFVCAIKNYQFQRDKANENKIENAREEMWKEKNEETVFCLQMFLKLCKGKEKEYQKEIKFAKALLTDYSRVTSLDANRDAIENAANQLAICEKYSKLSEDDIKKMYLSPEEKKQVESIMKNRIMDDRSKKKSAYEDGNDYLAIYNEQSDKITKAVKAYVDCVENSKISYDALKAIKNERDNTFKTVLDMFASDFAKKIISKDKLLEHFGGEEEMMQEFNNKEEFFKKPETLKDGNALLNINDLELSNTANMFKYYTNLIDVKEELIKLNDVMKKKDSLEEEDIQIILHALAKGQGHLKGMFEAAGKEESVPVDIANLEEGSKFFGNIFEFVANDLTIVDDMTAVHKKIMEKLPAELVSYKDLLDEHNKENGVVDKKTSFVKNKDFGKNRGSKKMFDPSLHPQEMIMGKK